MDFLDKVPTVMIVYLILLRIPKRLFVKLPLGHIYLKKSPPAAKRCRAQLTQHQLRHYILGGVTFLANSSMAFAGQRHRETVSAI